ncbi:hypothetical protein AB1N83_007387 [Pleurotus pulmonarius]
MTRPSTRSASRRIPTESHSSPCFTERSLAKTSATPLISSSSSLVQVLDFGPTEGVWGTPVTVRIKVKYNTLPALCTRLVFGHQAVNTTVQEFSSTGLAGWQLDAAIPRLACDAKIPMIVQVLDMNNKVIESLTFAEFTFRVPGPTKLASRPSSPAPKIKRCSSRPPPSSTTRNASSSATSVRRSQFHRRRKAPYCASDESEDDSTPVLRLLTPLESMCSDWTDEELTQGRRLVKFYKLQQGRDLLVSCEPLSQEDYHESDTVISCIHRKESQEFFATSVDIIYLLEQLTNDEFPVEEKNRIRRNLEGLRPVTVSKHKHGFERFFQTIMKFPEPRPRNIEKDLKVFSWHLLGQALAKILSKYTIVGPSKTRATKVEEPVLVPNQDWETYFPSDEEKPLMTHIRPSHTLKRESLLPSYLVDTSEDSPLPASVSLPDTEYDYWSPEEAVDANLAKAARFVMPKEEPFDDLSLAYPYDSW